MSTLQCQKCRTPLKLDASLQDLNPASFKLLADAAPALDPTDPDPPRSVAAKERLQKYDEVSRQANVQSQRRNAGQSHRHSMKATPPDMSYIMLTDSHVRSDNPGDVVAISPPHKTSRHVPPIGAIDNRETLSQQMAMAEQLFEVLSSRSDIDHPICSECTELVLDGLQKRQANAIRERDAYVEFLKQAQQDVPTDEEKAATKRDLEDAKRREKQALEELEALEAEKSRMEDELARLEAEADALDEEEEEFWRERNAFSTELAAFQAERDSLQSQVVHDTKVLESLQRTNVYNDTFCIEHDGYFATINGLRLGKLSDHPVDWPEINAALGQAVLLLAVVSEKLNYKFRNHKLIPMGSTSRIMVGENKGAQGGETKMKIYDLYSNGDLPLGLGGLFQGKLDSAMVEFLTCVRYLGDHVERISDKRTRLPYKIDKDKISDVSIQLRYGNDESWTRACKYLLTCCKLLLAHASHVDDSRNGSR